MHSYFYIRDDMLGPIVMGVGSFFPFKATYYLNGHSFIEHQLNRAQISFRNDDNAFLAVSDVAALQAAADKLGPEIIRKRLPSRPGELHPEPLTDPDVSLSTYPARATD
jgi:hypothetical protein